MSNRISFHVLYDRDSDVLYLTSREEEATKGKRDSYGIVWRYAADGDLIGATVMAFGDYWSDHIGLLETQLSQRFDVPVSQMHVVLQEAKK